FQAKANSVNARGSSLSSRSYPWLKSSRVQRPRSLAPLGGCPPVFRNRAMASSRFALSGVVVNVRMNFIRLSFRERELYFLFLTTERRVLWICREMKGGSKL